MSSTNVACTALAATPDMSCAESLYRHHGGWLRQWLQRRLGCRDQADDFAQSTFLKILSRLEAVPREPRAYLSTVAHGLLVDYWRRQDIERAYLAELAVQEVPLALSPESRAELLELLFEIDAFLDRQPAKVRRAFLLAQLDGLTYREIAAQLDVSERMVKKYMAQAMLACMAACGTSA